MPLSSLEFLENAADLLPGPSPLSPRTIIAYDDVWRGQYKLLGTGCAETDDSQAWLYLLAVLINAVNLFLQVFFTIMYSDLEWYVYPSAPQISTALGAAIRAVLGIADR